MIEWWGNTGALRSDPHFSSVSLLLHGNGANGSTTILDTSPRTKTITAVGDAQISTAQGRFGGSSIALDGNGDCLAVPANNDFNFGKILTIEVWCRFGAQGDFAILSGRGPTDGTFMLRRLADNTLRFGRSNVAFDLASPVLTWSTSQFYHVAAVTNGSTAYLFRDGVQVATGSNSQSYSMTAGSDTNWTIGAGQIDSNGDRLGLFMNGNFNGIRITKGIPRYETGTGANAGLMVLAGTNILALPTTPLPDF